MDADPQLPHRLLRIVSLIPFLGAKFPNLRTPCYMTRGSFALNTFRHRDIICEHSRHQSRGRFIKWGVMRPVIWAKLRRHVTVLITETVSTVILTSSNSIPSEADPLVADILFA